MRLIVLDSGPLGLLTRPRHIPAARACAIWLRSLLTAGVRVTIPAIADYEVRRELLRLGSTSAIKRLDVLGAELGVIPISNESLNHAAQLWADVRRTGRPTADPHALDGDVILVAQALLEVQPTEDLIVATTNVAHLSRFVTAALWEHIHAGVESAKGIGLRNCYFLFSLHGNCDRTAYLNPTPAVSDSVGNHGYMQRTV